MRSTMVQYPIYIPRSVISIGDKAFSSNNLSEVTLGSDTQFKSDSFDSKVSTIIEGRK